MTHPAIESLPVQTVVYGDGQTPVRPGDHIEYRTLLSWWRRKSGRVAYVPGISQLNTDMEFAGMAWVGISGTDGTFRGVRVDADSGRIKKSVRFVSRSNGSDYHRPDDVPTTQW
jgi:hypothetical protein